MRAIAALLAAVALAPAAAAAPAPPALHLIPGNHVVVTGDHFRPGERVTVTVMSVGLHVGHVLAVRGSFRIAFGTVHPARCAPMRILAAGNRGSRATLVLPARACTQPKPPSAAGTSG